MDMLLRLVLLLPVVQKKPPMTAGRKNGGESRLKLTTRPTSHIPIHITHWKNTPRNYGADKTGTNKEVLVREESLAAVSRQLTAVKTTPIFMQIAC